MVNRGKTKTSQPLVISRFRWQRCLWPFWLAISMTSFVALHQRLRSLTSVPDTYDPPKSRRSNMTLLEYSAIAPEGMNERQKIVNLLTMSKNGTVTIKEIVTQRPTIRQWTFLSYFFRGWRRNNPAEWVSRTWMYPLLSSKFIHFGARFYVLATEWLGDPESERSVMDNLVEALKRPLDRQRVLHSSSSGELSDEKVDNKYVSCAVVGNSGILLNGSYGAQIDSHEVVIRLNNAETRNKEQYVGSKTSISFMNSNIFGVCSKRPDCWCHPYGMDVPIVLYICQAQHLMDVAYCSPRYNSPLVVTESKLDALCARIAKWYSLTHFVKITGKGIEEWDSVHHDAYFHYSSGMQAIVLALGICDSIDIFGFGKPFGARHHYHTNQTKELGVHDYEAEYIFYDDLVNNRNVPLLTDAGISVPTVRIFH